MAMNFGSSVAGSPAHLNELSGSPVAVMHKGAWSTPMNQMFGFALAALIVSLVRLKPTVTMMLKPWLTKLLMSGAYCEASAGTTTFGASAPMSCAPFWAPSKEYWLKFLSSTVPTSVTTPILRAELGAALVAARVVAAGVEAAALDGGALVVAEGLGDAPELQAELTMASAAMRLAPTERVRMLPPHEVRTGPTRATSLARSTPGMPLGRILRCRSAS